MQRKAIYSENYVKNELSQDWDFHGEETQPHLHSLHPYPARFIPQIPRKAIQELSKVGDTVLDPFCGGGTTLLESILLNRNAIGIDNNEVAYLISKAKTTHYSEEDLENLKLFVKSIDFSLYNSEDNKIIIIPKYDRIFYWFDEQAVLDLGKLRGLIDQLDGKIKLLALAVFSSIIVRFSYQDSDTRYSRKQQEYKIGSAIENYKTKLCYAISRAEEIVNSPKALSEVFLGDGRKIDFIEKETINLIVTSPPYLNAYDYHKYHRHRLHWIDGNVKLARDHEIGKHDVFTRPNADPSLYFKDMNDCFIEWYRVLKKNGKALIVIGDAIVNKKPIAVADQFIEQLIDIGFKLDQKWVRTLESNKKSFNSASRINKEHVLLVSKQ